MDSDSESYYEHFSSRLDFRVTICIQAFYKIDHRPGFPHWQQGSVQDRPSGYISAIHSQAPSSNPTSRSCFFGLHQFKLGTICTIQFEWEMLVPVLLQCNRHSYLQCYYFANYHLQVARIETSMKMCLEIAQNKILILMSWDNLKISIKIHSQLQYKLTLEVTHCRNTLQKQ